MPKGRLCGAKSSLSIGCATVDDISPALPQNEEYTLIPIV